MLKNCLRAAAAALLMAAAAPAAQAQIKIKISSPTVNDASQEWARLFKERMDKRAPGKVTVEFYPANQLGNIPATVEGVALGTIEMVIVASGFYVGLEPRFLVFDTPGLFDNPAHGHKVFSDPDIRKRIQSFGNSKGVEAVSFFVHSPLWMLSHKPVRAVADLKGQKIRVPGGAPLHLEPFKKMGVSPLSLPLGEVLPAMQNKTIDGFIAGLTVFTAFKYYDVTKALTELPASVIIGPVLSNTRFIKSLGPDLEKIVREEAQGLEANLVPWATADIEKAKGVWSSNKGELIVMPPAEARNYLEQTHSVLPPILERNAAFKADYEALKAAADKYR
jgi:C4-dicarboxylate-binding protein DctP